MFALLEFLPMLCYKISNNLICQRDVAVGVKLCQIGSFFPAPNWWGGGTKNALVVRLLSDLELEHSHVSLMKKKRVGYDETKSVVSKFRSLAHLLTSVVRSATSNPRRCRFFFRQYLNKKCWSNKSNAIALLLSRRMETNSFTTKGQCQCLSSGHVSHRQS